MTQAKTSEEIEQRLSRLRFDITTGKRENQNNLLEEHSNFLKKLWLPADKAVIIEDVEKMIDELKTPDDYTEEEIAIYAYACLDLKQKLNSLKGGAK